MATSLKTQLTWPVIGAVIALGLVTFILLYVPIRARLLAEFDEALTARAGVLTSLTALEEADEEEGEPEPFLEFDFDADFLPAFADPKGGAYFQLWHDGEEMARSGSLGDGSLVAAPVTDGEHRTHDAVLPDGRAGRMLTLSFQPYLDEEWGEDLDREARLAQVALRYPGRKVPWLTLAVAVDRGELDRTLIFIGGVLAGGLVILVVVVSIGVGVNVRRSLVPLEEAREQLQAIDADRLDLRLDQDRLPKELVPVAGTVNGLLDRLQQAFEKERHFSRNIAHELRTPIAELRSIGEVGEQWPNDPEANQRFFGDIRQIGNRMDLMVTNLLMIARQESGQIQCAWEPVDLPSTLSGIHDRFRGECEEHGIAVSIDGRHALPVMADRVFLDIIATNLIANAVHHGRGDVDVQVYSDGARAGFAVQNPVDGLDDSDLPFLFDRFWRKDTARRTGRHAGLGLALVKSLSDVCDWRVEAELDRRRLLRIRIDGLRHSEGGR